MARRAVTGKESRMTTKTDDTTTKNPTPSDTGRTTDLGGTVSDAAGTVRDAAADAAAKLPDVASSTRAALVDANRQMRTGSDEMLAMGSALSFGLAGGLLLGNAPRIFVAGALIPAVMMVLTLLERSGRTGRPSSPSLKGG
jgi:hypothetical protein